MMALDETEKSRRPQSRSNAPFHKMQPYLRLLGLPTIQVPGFNSGAAEIPAPFPETATDSGLKLMLSEKDKIDNANAATDWKRAIGILEARASIIHVFPTIVTNGMSPRIGV